MDKKYLLTYQSEGKGWGTFSWFETEEELFDFVDNNNINVLDAIRIDSAENL